MEEARSFLGIGLPSNCLQTTMTHPALLPLLIGLTPHPLEELPGAAAVPSRDRELTERIFLKGGPILDSLGAPLFAVMTRQNETMMDTRGMECVVIGKVKRTFGQGTGR